jgi:sulfite reductase (ferredoxin)
MTEVKETKAQRAERLKREKNPWEALEDIRAFARGGRSSVSHEWESSYFRWWGIYTQGDGLGVTGGKGGEGKVTEYFMMRIPLVNGLATSRQIRIIADIAENCGRNLADITVRQSIQLHWLTIEDLPEIIGKLEESGLSTKGACGDVVRNLTGCPLAGLTDGELIDGSPFALSIAKRLRANAELYNLPRKFKVSVAGCPVWCSYPEVNDIGFTATVRGSGDQREVGFSVRVGGALSKEPHLAVRLDAFIRQEQITDVAMRIAEIFRDQLSLRESRDRARMKYLFLKQGWTAESFLAELNSRLGYTLDPGVEEQIPDDVFRDHVGIHAQKQPGLCFVGVSVLSGRLTAVQLRSIADLAERFGDGHVRTTVMQNLIIPNVPKEKALPLVTELEAIGLRVEGSTFWRGGIACTGTEFCKLAITETKGFLRWVVDELEDRLPEFDQQLKLHITGCSNSCGQHWIADIGMEGKKIKQDGKMVDAYYFCLGGAVGLHQHTSRPVGYRCLAAEVPEAIERLLRKYIETRNPGENLRAYFTRHTEIELRDQLTGTVTVPVEQNVPAGAAVLAE